MIAKYINLAIKNSGSLFVMKAIGIAINYLVLVAIIHFYKFEGNGEYAIFMSQSRALQVLLIFGLDYLIVKALNANSENARDDQASLFIVFVINTLLFTSVFLIIHQFFDISLYILAGVISFAFWRFISHYFRGKNNMVLYGFFEFIFVQAIALLAILICNYIYTFNFIAMILVINGLMGLFMLLLIFFKLSKEYTISELMAIFKKSISTLIITYRKAVHFVLTNSINIISIAIIYYLIKDSFSKEVLGIYDTILRFSQILSLPLIATNGRAFTLINKYFINNEKLKLKQYIQSITRMLMIFSSALFVAVLIFFYLFASYYDTTLKPYWLLFLLLCLTQLLNNWAGPVGITLQATDNEKIFGRITLFSALFLLVSTFIFIRFFDINSIGLAVFLQIAMINYFSLRVQKRNLGINPFKKK